MNLTRSKTAELDAKADKATRKAGKATAVSAVTAAKAATEIQAARAARSAATMAHTAASATGKAGGVAQGMSTGVKQGVYNSRAWAAPQLNNAADFCTNTVAPRLSAALRSTARQVQPGDFTGTSGKGRSSKARSKGIGKMTGSQKSMKSRLVTWALLGLAAGAAAGAAAALARYRYKESIAVNTETADEAGVVTEEERRTATFYPAPTDPVEDGDMPTTARVRSTGW